MEKDQIVANVLKELGIQAHKIGYYYLKDAILYRIDKGFVRSDTGNMYREVAKKHDATWTQVERAIRTSIDKGTVIGKQQVYQKLFFYTMEPDGHVKNSVFINTVAEYCMRLYNEHK